MDKDDINVGDRVTFFYDDDRHHNGLVVGVIDMFEGFAHSQTHLEYNVLCDDGLEYVLYKKRHYLERDYITERDIKIDNILKDDETDTEI